ncbi:MAG: peptide chain release factor N(5)-glutamine methyltransferase, partial [Rickettsiales bacterium]
MKTNLALDIEQITIGEAVAEAMDALSEAGIPSAHLDARLLLAHVLHVSREYLTMHADDYLTEVELMAYDMLIERRVAREPMAQILGQREFWSLPFKVTQATLDPRPDSETIVASVLSYVPRRDARLMMADFGVGTGCLLLSLLSEYPNAHGLGVDVSEDALSVAEDNAQTLGLSSRAHFFHSSWGEGVVGKYDVIVSNPPYIPEADIAGLEPEVAEYEPKAALSGGADGLDAYRELMPHIKRLLAEKGIAVLEYGKGQSQAVKAIAEQHGLRVLEVCKDLAGVQR